uniref:MFS domain-containing protein n=1 Tax=Panagrellus redivivus TaxID=6233 RepID=A0A7E4VDG5_PANRE
MPLSSEEDQPSCWHGTRYIILIVSLLALTFVFANSIALNVTVICMVKENQNESSSTKTPLYDNLQKSWLFSAVAFGNLIGAIPLMAFAQRWDTRWVFTVYGMASGISMLLMPLGVSVHYGMVFVLRMMQGFGLSICFTSLGSIVNSWAPLKSSGLYISLLSLHMQLGPLIILSVSGIICESRFGWPALYYLFGGLTILSFILFAILYKDDASKHACVTPTEAARIQEGRAPRGTKRPSTPYKAVFTDIVIIGVFFSTFAACLGLQFMMQYGPLYLNNVLGLDVKATAIAAAAPYLLGVVVKFIAGPISDSLTCLSERGRVILFNTLAARQHSGFIMAMMGVINSLVILMLPLLVALVAPEGTNRQWAIIFFILSGIVIVLMFFFNFVCKTTPRSWTMAKEAENKVVTPPSPDAIQFEDGVAVLKPDLKSQEDSVDNSQTKSI